MICCRAVVAWIVIAAGMTAGTHASVAEPAKVIAELQGRYSKHFQNGMMSGEKYWSDDVVEIVPIAKDAAYVRASLQFANGHTCDIWGVAQVEGDKLTYREQAEPTSDPPCVLRIFHDGSKLQLDDADSCHPHCGMRGTLTWSLPFESRRPIHYMDRLISSPQYVEALKIWHDIHRTN